MSREAGEVAIRERVQTIYLGNSQVLARVLGRYKMVLETSDQGFARHLMLDGYWESWATRFLASRLRPGMTVVDVGANYGYYTLLFGGSVVPGGQVIAVEPNPAIARVLRQNVELNGFAGYTAIHEVALGDRQEAAMRFFVPQGEPKNGLLAQHVVDRPGETIEVPMTTLDEILGERRVDLIKIDAEGGEPGIIMGMKGTMARCRPAVLVEFNAARYQDAGAVLDMLLDVYGRAHDISFEGKAERISREAILSEKVGEDWLLFFE